MFGTNAYAQAPFAAAGGNAFFVSISETVVAQDAFRAAATFAVQFSDSATAADTTAARFSIFSAVSEAATGSDTASSSFTVGASISEIATATDTLDTNTVFPAQLSESAAALAQFVSNVNFQVSLSESATAQAIDFVAAQTFAVSISEGVFALDSLLSRELWELIDDTQSAGWTDILVPTTIDDIAVFGGANFGVLTYAGNLQQRYDPNPVVWNEVDDTQDTVWTDIVAV